MAKRMVSLFFSLFYYFPPLKDFSVPYPVFDTPVRNLVIINLFYKAQN